MIPRTPSPSSTQRQQCRRKVWGGRYRSKIEFSRRIIVTRMHGICPPRIQHIILQKQGEILSVAKELERKKSPKTCTTIMTHLPLCAACSTNNERRLDSGMITRPTCSTFTKIQHQSGADDMRCTTCGSYVFVPYYPCSLDHAPPQFVTQHYDTNRS